jgi:3-hydroxyisobutyrate dehydrogenase-like beta-hydroxyacid dehydrogenase
MSNPSNAKHANLGILHPGEMGLSIAASAQNSGLRVYWVSAGRSKETAERAARIGLEDAGSLGTMCERCSVIISVCPPDAAEDVATHVLAEGFTGLYVDMNAIAPQRAVHIGEMMSAAGARFVDGGIIGGPAWKPNATWAYLSGDHAQEVADCFVAGPLGTRIIGTEIGKASALKMCFAAYTKGTTALLAAVMATADGLGVRAELKQQWAQDGSGFAQEAEKRVTQVTAKAWRFAGEMDEIAATLEAVGLPDGFHLAAAEVYRRLAEFKGAPTTPDLDAVLATLQSAEKTTK